MNPHERLQEYLSGIDDVEVTNTHDFMGHNTVDFIIGDYDDYKQGRVATSSVSFMDGCVHEARIHAPTVVQNFAMDEPGCSQDIRPGVSVAVINHVCHVYLDDEATYGDLVDVVEAVTSDGSGTVLDRVQALR